MYSRALEIGREHRDRVGQQLLEQLDHRLLALLGFLEELREHLDAEADVALFVAGDVRHPLAEAGHRAGVGEVVLDEMLPRLRQGRLDDHVVERDRAGEVRQRAVAPQVVGHPVEAVEDVPIAPAELRLGVGERGGDRVAGADHLLEEPVEEDRVACLVDLLGGEEVLLLGPWRRVDVGGEVVGDGVLAVEEHRVDPARRAPLDLGQRLPAVAVLGEVDRRRLPVRPFPALVEIVVADPLGCPRVLMGDAHQCLLDEPLHRAMSSLVPRDLTRSIASGHDERRGLQPSRPD